jgi:hypothetical protein
LSHRRGTVEEKVLELQQTKRELADAIITPRTASSTISLAKIWNFCFPERLLAPRAE